MIIGISLLWLCHSSILRFWFSGKLETTNCKGNCGQPSNISWELPCHLSLFLEWHIIGSWQEKFPKPYEKLFGWWNHNYSSISLFTFHSTIQEELVNLCTARYCKHLIKNLKMHLDSFINKFHLNLKINKILPEALPNVCWDAPFLNPFFATGSWLRNKIKKIQRWSIPTNIWPFLFCQGFSKI